MEELGAGGTVSELISCHGINYGNQRTIDMLRVDPREKNMGLQLFGEDPEAMARAASVAQEYGPGFIDINMGCPVRKVVSKGGGSALMKDTQKLGKYFGSMKKVLEIPLTVKIRTGWDQENLNAPEVIRIAKEEGLEMVAVHGRTRTQQYTGKADWDYLEYLAGESPLPFIGNGDLHSTKVVKEKLQNSHCQAFMLARGPLRNPFIFLEPFLEDGEEGFHTNDYLEVVERLAELLEEKAENERRLLVQLRKHIVWLAQGFPHSSTFRGTVFKTRDMKETMDLTRDFFLSQAGHHQKINLEEPFMTSGHG